MRQMKDSRIEWIGQIPENINVIRNKYLIKYEKGKLPKDLNTEKIGIPYVGASELEDLSGEAEYTTYTTDATIPQCDSSDVLILWDGARAGLIGTNHSGAVSSTIVNALPTDGIDKRFWYWYLKAFQQHLYNRVNGTTIPHMNTDYIEEIMMLDWKVETQIRIAHFLDTKCAEIDALIGAKEKTNALLKERRQSIIYEAVTKGLNPAAPMKDSGIEWVGLIPKDWAVGKTIYGLEMPITDGPHETPQLYSEGVPFISAEAVSCGNGNIDFNHIRGYISEEYYTECCKKYIPQINDIYMIKSGATTGKVAIVDTDRRFTIWSPLAVFRCAEQKCYYKYLYYFLQSDAYQKQVEASWSFGTQQNIGMRTLERLLICYPSVSEQKKIADYLDTCCSKTDLMIASNEVTVQKLKEYRQSIIYEAVTGKIEI